MLDDALEVATRLGRGGRGCVVVLPTGRETSSPKGSVHASLSLSLGDPGQRPARPVRRARGVEGRWFSWREQHGRLRPFANRGPAVRCLAPGDDVAYPFLAAERLFHAESSGASALAAGGGAPRRLEQPHARVGRGALAARPVGHAPGAALRGIARQHGRSRGRAAPGPRSRRARRQARLRTSARPRACIAAADPVCLELVAMGEDQAARAWVEARRQGQAAGAYSRSLARWAVRVLLRDPASEHAFRVVLRHMRLLASDPRRSDSHANGAVARQLAVLLRGVVRGCKGSPSIRRELRGLERAAREATQAVGQWEAALLELAQDAFTRTRPGSRAKTTAGIGSQRDESV